MRTIMLPAELCKRAEQRYAHKFSSLEQLLEFMLSELLRDDELQAERREQQMIEQRLRDLGYL